MDESRRARVVSVGRNAAWIAFDGDNAMRVADIPKRLERLTLVPGDLVRARPLEDGRVVIESREQRSFALERTTAGGRRKTMAANVDTIAIVAAFENPPLHPAMIDELLVFAEIHGLRAVLLFTKPDLIEPARAEATLALYRRIGYTALAINPRAGRIEGVVAELAGRHTLLIGQSGVGKSSLFQALGGESIVGELSKIGRGKQTTTSARLHRFPGGFLIDSPGVGEFEVRDRPWSETAAGFVEFVALEGECRFRDCSHRNEPDCAVKNGVLAGRIAESRYESYRTIADRA
jgi:ribosome biogenesis GTPase